MTDKIFREDSNHFLIQQESRTTKFKLLEVFPEGALVMNGFDTPSTKEYDVLEKYPRIDRSNKNWFKTTNT